MSFGLRMKHRPKAEIAEKVARAAKILQLEDYLQRKPAQLSGRAAPARRHRSGDRARPEGVSVRRAAQQSRCRAAGADARRNRQAAQGARQHDDLRNARPDRSADHGRSDRRAARRAHRADRHASQSLSGSRQRIRGGFHRLAADELSVSHRPGGRPAGSRGHRGGEPGPDAARTRKETAAWDCDRSTSTRARASASKRAWNWSKRWAPRPTFMPRWQPARPSSRSGGRPSPGPATRSPCISRLSRRGSSETMDSASGERSDHFASDRTSVLRADRRCFRQVDSMRRPFRLCSASI